MLIDAFNDDFPDMLDTRAAELSFPNRLYLLIDGAFVPGLHKAVATEDKSLLFASLPGFSDNAADASPFLTPYIRDDKQIRSLLRRCSGWPMLSLIETPESLAQLAARLSVWCIVEADDQRFNFRFPDTRRLPAIFRTLNCAQREQFVGPAVRWSYISRDSRWNDLDLTRAGAEPATNPVLDSRQFAALVDDSQVDEMLVLLGNRANEVDKHPSVSHARVSAALLVAVSARLDDDDALDWCEWYWRHAETGHECAANAAFQIWQNAYLMEK
jgi:hypothetical protein